MADPQTKPDAGAQSQDLASQWRSFDDAKRTRLLGKMSAEQKHTLRGLLEAKPTPSAAAPTKPPAPVPSFLSRVSSRVAGGLHDINQAVTKTIAATEPHTPEHAEMVKALSGGPKLSQQGKDLVTPPGVIGPVTQAAADVTLPFRAMVQTIEPTVQEWFQDPANLAGDVLTAFMLGGGEIPKLRSPGRGAASLEPRVVPRPTEITSPGTGIDSPTGYPHGLSAEQWTDYVDKVNKAYHDHMQDVSDYASAEAKRRAQYARKSYGATQKIADQVEAVNKRNVLDRGSQEYTDLARKNIRDVHQTVRGRLDSRWNQFRENMSGSTVDSVQVGDVIQKARSSLRGSPADLKLFNDVIRESGVEVSDTGEVTMGPDADPNMPVDTARVHSSAIGDKLASGNLPGNVYQSLKTAKEGMEGLIQKAADARGQGGAYRQLKVDWSRYMRDWNDMRGVATGKGSVLARALRVPDASYLRGLITGTGGDLLLETFGAYRDAGANPDLVSNARSLSRQSAAVKVPVGAATDIPPTVRDRLQTAGVGKYEPSPPPTLKEVPVPKPEPPKPGGRKPFWKKAARVGGGVTAAGASSALGVHHPLAAYVVGGEAAEFIYDRVTGKRVPNPQYTGPQRTPTTVPAPPPNAPAVPPDMLKQFTGEWQPVTGPEEGMEAARRRGSGGLSPADRVRLANDKVNSLKMQIAREEAAGAGNRYNTVSKLQAAEEELANLQRDILRGTGAQAPQILSRQGRGGANYTAEQLEEIKRRHGIK